MGWEWWFFDVWWPLYHAYCTFWILNLNNIHTYIYTYNIHTILNYTSRKCHASIFGELFWHHEHAMAYLVISVLKGPCLATQQHQDGVWQAPAGVKPAPKFPKFCPPAEREKKTNPWHELWVILDWFIMGSVYMGLSKSQKRMGSISSPSINQGFQNSVYTWLKSVRFWGLAEWSFYWSTPPSSTKPALLMKGLWKPWRY